MPGPMNCLLGVCCPPNAQREKLVEEIHAALQQGGSDSPRIRSEEDVSRICAAYVLDNFDLAPKDSVTPLFHKIAELARE